MSTYISTQDIRDQGVTQAMVSDDAVLAAIELWQDVLERACRQWFEKRDMTISLDGNDSDTLQFGVPIVSIDYIKLNGSSVELGSELYKVYNQKGGWPDDRKNPRIKLIRSTDFPDIYTAPISLGELKFRKGRQNQEIKGSFGFVETDESTPRLIKRALTKLVVEKIMSPIFGSPPGTPPIVNKYVVQEKTDGHSIKYSDVGKSRPGLIGITHDREILDIMKLFKAPIGIGAPADWSWRTN